MTPRPAFNQLFIERCRPFPGDAVARRASPLERQRGCSDHAVPIAVLDAVLAQTQIGNPRPSHAGDTDRHAHSRSQP